MTADMSSVDLSATLDSLRAVAAAQVSRYPQYAGHFADYRLVRIRKDVTTKAGLAFRHGEYALATEHRDELPDLPSSGKYVTVWSRRNRVDTSVRVADVEWL